MSTLRDRLKEPPVPRGLLPFGTEPIAQALVARSYGLAPFAPPDALIGRVFDGWRKFLALSIDERYTWRIQAEDPDEGYVLRRPKDPQPARCGDCRNCVADEDKAAPATTNRDKKDFFHWKPNTQENLKRAGADCSKHAEWLVAMAEMHRFCCEASHQVLVELDGVLPGFDFVKRSTLAIARENHVLRLLSYRMPMEPGQTLADDHTDRDFMTMHVAETHQGLRIKLPPDKPAPARQDGGSNFVPFDYTPTPGNVLMFMGDKAAALTGNEFRTIRHGVYVPDDFVPQPITEPRLSMVFFYHTFPLE